MNGKEIITEIMRIQNFSQERLAKQVGFKNQSAISEMLRRQDIKLSNFIKLLTAMGADVKITCGKNTWVIDSEDFNEKS